MIEQRQVGAVIQHVGDDDQVEAVGLGEEVRRVAQRHFIQCGVSPAGFNGQWVEVAGHHFQRAGLGRRNRRHAGAGAEVQHAFAPHPFGVLGQPARQDQAAGPAEAPVGRFFKNAPGFFGVEGAVHVVGVNQPQFERGAGQGFCAEPSIPEQCAERRL